MNKKLAIGGLLGVVFLAALADDGGGISKNAPDITAPAVVPVRSTTKTVSPASAPVAAPVRSSVQQSVPRPQPAAEKRCHPSYSGCLNPNASDYDCAGGSGNGPYYTGPVQVLGLDVFGLDRDGDGWGCE